MRDLRLLIIPSLLSLSFGAAAQDVGEAYRFSNLSTQGTARSMGFGNALGSVGGDFSSLSVNPAGIGVYRSSEFLITPSLKINATSSNYTGFTTNDNFTQVNFNNFGLILTDAPKGKRYDRRAGKTVSFGFGMNRVADFNNSVIYNGKNSTSSASQVFESDANNDPASAASTAPTNTLGYMGYQSYLLNLNSSGMYETIVPYGGGVYQQKSTQTTGGIKEYTFSMGGNYRERLMLGITLGIPVINYHGDTYYQESLADGNTSSNPSGFKSFSYNQSLDIAGVGINAKVGAIFKVSEMFRLGVALHTPTYYSISEVYNPGITTTHTTSNIDTASILSVNDGSLMQNSFDYHLTTPAKGILSATMLLNKFGFISADFEYVDYSSMKYSFQNGIDNVTNQTYQQEADQMNQVIKKTYKGASNFRIGGEGVVTNSFMLRAGFGYYGNAYTTYGQSVQNNNYTTERIDLSLGAGFHYRNFYADIAIVHGIYSGYELPYSIDYSGVVSTGTPAVIPTAKVNYSTNNVALTFKFKLDNKHAHREGPPMQRM